MSVALLHPYLHIIMRSSHVIGLPTYVLQHTVMHICKNAVISPFRRCVAKTRRLPEQNVTSNSFHMCTVQYPHTTMDACQCHTFLSSFLCTAAHMYDIHYGVTCMNWYFIQRMHAPQWPRSVLGLRNIITCIVLRYYVGQCHTTGQTVAFLINNTMPWIQ
jgi:hypothetical protein